MLKKKKLVSFENLFFRILMICIKFKFKLKNINKVAGTWDNGYALYYPLFTRWH